MAWFFNSNIPTVLAMVILLIAAVAEWYWVWGLFFIYWAISGIVNDQAFVVRIVHRDENPILFWFISISWLVLSAAAIWFDLVNPAFIS